MHKYKVIKSDLFLKGKIIPENSEVNLSEEEIKGIEEYLVKCHPELVEGSHNSKETKIKKVNK